MFKWLKRLFHRETESVVKQPQKVYYPVNLPPTLPNKKIPVLLQKPKKPDEIQYPTTITQTNVSSNSDDSIMVGMVLGSMIRHEDQQSVPISGGGGDFGGGGADSSWSSNNDSSSSSSCDSSSSSDSGSSDSGSCSSGD